MFVVEITFDTCSATEQDVHAVIDGGEVVQVTGVLNELWDDYSASELALQCAFDDVDWSSVRDSTCGSLSLTLKYSILPPVELLDRLFERGSIEEYEIGWKPWNR